MKKNGRIERNEIEDLGDDIIRLLDNSSSNRLTSYIQKAIRLLALLRDNLNNLDMYYNTLENRDEDIALIEEINSYNVVRPNWCLSRREILRKIKYYIGVARSNIKKNRRRIQMYKNKENEIRRIINGQLAPIKGDYDGSMRRKIAERIWRDRRRRR